MFVGAYIGAHYVTRLNDLWLKRIFLTTVFLLAVKIYDFDTRYCREKREMSKCNGTY